MVFRGFLHDLHDSSLNLAIRDLCFFCENIVSQHSGSVIHPLDSITLFETVWSLEKINILRGDQLYLA